MTRTVDQNGVVYSVGMGFFDQKTLYMVLGSSDPELRAFGPEYLMYHDMIGFAMEKGLVFDFEGSMMENIEIRNRSFGAKQVPYLSVSFSSRSYRMLRSIRSML
jgi:hypothetical protein